MSDRATTEAAERATHVAEQHLARARDVLSREMIIGGLSYAHPAAVLADLHELRALLRPRQVMT